MAQRTTWIGHSALHTASQTVSGRYVDLDGEPFYCISHFDRLDPFFMTVVSGSDHWLFISSNGSLSAGRRSPEHALFPYETDDKIHDGRDRTGSKTIIRLQSEHGDLLWEPFSNRYEGLYDTERFLYKNVTGNKLVFEEINHTLNHSFRYAWLVSDRFGLVRRAQLSNLGTDSARLRFLDGLLNLLPANVARGMQTSFSTLVDAYKKSELLADSGIGIFSLSSIPVDRAEPSESLTANIVWSTGLTNPQHLLSSRQLDLFRTGGDVHSESEIRGLRGAYLVGSECDLPAGDSATWFLVAEVDQRQDEIAALHQCITSDNTVTDQLLADIDRGTDSLNNIVGEADGLQLGGDRLQTARHFSNTLFNVMRGGIFDDGYQIAASDLLAFIPSANKSVSERNGEFLGSLPDRFSFAAGLASFQSQRDADLERLYFEYLPLTFSRRHGDPSRPWNQFSIATRNPDGSRILSYQGNWRDIFQNWEALGLSYPEYLESIVFKFVNASTADGYNPYRITRNGIDWEVHDPDDPWSNIGYWGDHQIIYLLKLLEHSDAYHPGLLQEFLDRSIFVYAHVPYLIKPLGSLLENPRDSISFDHSAHKLLCAHAERIGSDGKLLRCQNGDLLRVNLAEKLLVPLLAKMANFIPEAGIWMNTQRPEWNDANNALVGFGVSMVTLCHLRRYVDFCSRVFVGCDRPTFEVSSEVAVQFGAMHETLQAHEHRLPHGFDAGQRRVLLDALGGAGSHFRESLYRDGLSGSTSPLTNSAIIDFLRRTRQFLDQSIDANRRDDSLYHSYNLMALDADGGVVVRHLDEMLEGQVAVLASGKLDSRASLDLLHALRSSKLYRPDQHSYLLYPDRDLPGFMEKNILQDSAIKTSPLLKRMLEQRDGRIVSKDVGGQIRFNPAFRNADQLAKALHALENCPPSDHTAILAAYESVFDHQSFTGRSGTFFKYEGLGCVYWHMVSKLLVAVQEICLQAKARGENPELINHLVDCYRSIQEGIGARKSVSEQGAFPTDPYSHTPSMMGAQQPGLTGQVKEDFIARMTEFGIRVEGGCLHFDPFLLPDSEFLSVPAEFAGITLGAGSIAATICKVPVVIRKKATSQGVRVTYRDGQTAETDTLTLDSAISRDIFARNGAINRIEVSLVG